MAKAQVPTLTAVQVQVLEALRDGGTFIHNDYAPRALLTLPNGKDELIPDRTVRSLKNAGLIVKAWHNEATAGYVPTRKGLDALAFGRRVIVRPTDTIPSAAALAVVEAAREALPKIDDALAHAKLKSALKNFDKAARS